MILFVDDEASIREIAKLVFESKGLEIIVLDNGNDGLDKFIEHKNSITHVFLDMQLPGMSGKELAKQIKKMRSDVIIISIAGFIKNEHADFWLKKPFRGERLLDYIN